MVCGAPATQRWFPGVPAAAGEARRFVAHRVTHPYADLLVGELFAAVLAAGSYEVLVTVTRPGGRIRITAYGTMPMSLAVVPEVSRQILSTLADRIGVAPDMCGLWAEIPAG